jgi:hypothetical protein
MTDPPSIRSVVIGRSASASSRAVAAAASSSPFAWSIAPAYSEA